MAIDWFPGHMLTARKEAAETLRKVDVVIEVLDARVPLSSLNPMIETLRVAAQRPALKVLNKIDLADPARTRAWLDYFNARPATKAVGLSAKNAGEVGRIPEYCRTLAPHRGTKLKQLRMMILGVPNVGKSSLMNALLKRSVAKVGNEPAVTKHQMRHELGQTASIVDTPGMLWPGVEQVAAYKLAATYSIGRNAFQDEDVAVELGRFLLAEYPALIAGRYGAPPEGTDGHSLLSWIATRRGLVRLGAEPDVEKAAGVFLQDFRTGVLGRITLEMPPA